MTTRQPARPGELVAELGKDPDKQVERAVDNFRMPSSSPTRGR
jgi:hypothetical protein